MSCKLTVKLYSAILSTSYLLPLNCIIFIRTVSASLFLKYLDHYQSITTNKLNRYTLTNCTCSSVHAGHHTSASSHSAIQHGCPFKVLSIKTNKNADNKTSGQPSKIKAIQVDLRVNKCQSYVIFAGLINVCSMSV